MSPARRSQLLGRLRELEAHDRRLQDELAADRVERNEIDLLLTGDAS